MQSMSRKGNCLDNAATEQVFGHLKDEFLRGGQWPDFAGFKRDLEACIVHWNRRRRWKRPRGPALEEFRSQPPVVWPYLTRPSFGRSSSFGLRS